MVLTYFKRYRMEIHLRGWRPDAEELPSGYRMVAWQPSLLGAFAEAKYRSFREEMDSQVFPCLGELSGCRRLMSEIVAKPGFVAGATWLLVHAPVPGAAEENCGTVQGVRDREGVGAIQNLGVTPSHRGRGLGAILMAHALSGFRQAGVKRVYLEVTAENVGAIRLYERLGFRTIKTIFKAAESVRS